MKKSVLALATLVSLSGAAMAQSSVTVFGIVDLAMRNLKGDDDLKLLSNEGRAASRLGFRGVEDLGGGMKASFHIEHGLNADDGTTDSVFWQRRATVSLSGGFGEVRLGRHKTATRTIVDDFDPFGTSGMPALSRIYGPLAGLTLNRADNQVAYIFPAMGGFYGNVEVNAGENSNNSNSHRGVAGRIGYKAGALNVSAAYGQHGTGNKLKSATVGGSYDFGAFMLSGMYTKNEAGAADQSVLHVGATVKLGQGKLIGSFGKADGNGTTTVAGTPRQNADATLIAIGYDYSLSKRTTLYTTYARIDNKEATRFTLNGAKGAALIASGSPLGRDSTGYEFGIRHNF